MVTNKDLYRIEERMNTTFLMNIGLMIWLIRNGDITHCSLGVVETSRRLVLFLLLIQYAQGLSRETKIYTVSSSIESNGASQHLTELYQSRVQPNHKKHIISWYCMYFNFGLHYRDIFSKTRQHFSPKLGLDPWLNLHSHLHHRYIYLQPNHKHTYSLHSSEH